MHFDPDARIPGELAPIVSSTLDPTAVLSLDPGNSSLKHALDLLQSLEAWEPHMLVPWDHIPSFFARGTSRRMRKHHARLMHYRVIRAVDPHDIKVVTNFFTVDKKDETLRLVVDGRKVNVLMEPPPKMELPTIYEVIDYLMDNEYALTVDGTSYFYQFGISDEVGNLFCANLADARGDFTPVALTRMPMGWAYAPYIAQKISNTLLRGRDGRILGVAWIDNFIFAGKTREEVEANFQEFLSQCDLCNIHIDNRNPKPSTILEALGIVFDLKYKRYQLDPEWVGRRDFTLSQVMTARRLYEITGSAIWHDYVKKIPLCHRSECIDIIRRVATLISPTQEWDTPLSFTPEELQHLQDWTNSVKANMAAFWLPKVAPELDLWSDASDAEWAAMMFQYGELLAAEQGSFTGEHFKWHIFLKEAYAADVVIQATKGIHRAINIDNKPLVQCISRGFSSNKFVNNLIRNWDLDNITARWVSTEVQKADPYTRGQRFPATLPSLRPKS